MDGGAECAGGRRECNRPHGLTASWSAELVRLVRDERYDLLVVHADLGSAAGEQDGLDVTALLRQAPCRVFLTAPPAIPLEPERQ